MEKIFGTSGRQDGLQHIGRNKWLLFFGYYETAEGEYEYRHTFNHCPTLDEVKDIVLSQMNADIDEKILCGFVWRDMPVWLSSENQFNYKAAYDLAVQTDGATLPVRFKFGINDTPIYHTFNDLSELTDFYTKALAHVNETLNEGWTAKDNINWEKFKVYE